MIREQFLKLMEESFDIVRELEAIKHGEYTAEGEDDRLSHFKEIGAITGEPAHQALRGMMVKHTKSIYDMLKARQTAFSPKMWDEKIHDHILYLTLLRGLIIERYSNVEDIQSNEAKSPATNREPTPYDKLSMSANPEKARFKPGV